MSQQPKRRSAFMNVLLFCVLVGLIIFLCWFGYKFWLDIRLNF